MNDLIFTEIKSVLNIEDNLYFRDIIKKNNEIHILNDILKVDSDILAKEITTISNYLDKYKQYLKTEITLSQITITIYN